MDVLLSNKQRIQLLYKVCIGKDYSYPLADIEESRKAAH